MIESDGIIPGLGGLDDQPSQSDVASLIDQLEAERGSNALEAVESMGGDAHNLAGLLGLDQQRSGANQHLLAERNQKQMAAIQV